MPLKDLVKRAAYGKKRYMENRQEHIEYSSKRYWGDLERVKAIDRYCYKNSPYRAKWNQMLARSRRCGWEFVMTREEFKDWFLTTPDKCFYCDLTDLSLDMKLPAGIHPYFFTIDRKVPILHYTLPNMVKSCWRCNNLKRDFFTVDEWREIAQKYVKPKWMAAMGMANAA